MELGILNFFAICLLLTLAGVEYSKFNIVTPWPAFLVVTCLNLLVGYYFIPVAAVGIGDVDVISTADQALLINLSGIFTCLVSFYLVAAFNSKQNSLNELSDSALEQPESLAFENVSDRKASWVYGFTAIFTSLVIFSIMAYAGIFPLLSEDVAEARTFINDLPGLRPIYNFATSIVNPILVFVSLMCVLKWREFPKLVLIPAFLLFGTALLTGNRSFVAGIFGGVLIGLSMLWIVGRSRFKINYPLYVGSQFLFIFLGGLSGLARDITFNKFLANFVTNPLEILGYSLYYAYAGNNFSDLRDFSWILSKFDGEYYYGSTLITGFLSFVPTAILPLKEEYLFSRVTNKIVGLPTDSHFGIRASTFGEWYVNFGWAGAIFLGLILGIGYALLQQKFWQYFSTVKGKNWKVYSLMVLYFIPNIVESFIATSGNYNILIQLLLLIFVYFFSRTNAQILPMELDNQQQRTAP